jgi:ACS family hexuronate transporter-like MFS transporter
MSWPGLSAANNRDAASSRAPSLPPIRWVYAGLLLLASVINYIDRQTLSVLTVTMQRELHLSDVQYGDVVQCFLLTYMVMYVVSGRLVDRYGAWRTQAVFLFAWSIADALTGFSVGFVSLACGRAALGAAEPGNYTASLRAVGDWFSAKERSIAVGIYSMGGTLGAAIAVPVVAAIALRRGWRYAFFLTGAIGIAIALTWLLIYRDPPGRGAAAPRVPWSVVLRQPYIAVMLITRTMTDSVWYFFLFWSLKYMQEHYDLGLKAVGSTLWVLFVAADAGSLLGGLLSSRFVPRFGPLGSRFTAMLPAAACMMLLAVVPSLQSIGIAVGILSFLAFCHMAWMTNVTTATLDLFPSAMATTVQGMIGAASAIGGLLSAAVISRTIQAHGYRPIFYLMAVMHPLAAVILFTRLRPAMRRRSVPRLIGV